MRESDQLYDLHTLNLFYFSSLKTFEGTPPRGVCGAPTERRMAGDIHMKTNVCT